MKWKLVMISIMVQSLSLNAAQMNEKQVISPKADTRETDLTQKTDREIAEEGDCLSEKEDSLPVFQEAQIDEKWEVFPNTYTMRTDLTYNKDHISRHYELCLGQAESDYQVAGGEEYFHVSFEKYKEYYEKFLNFYADLFKKRVASFLVFTKGAHFIGGSYYMLEKEGKIIRFTSLAYQPTLSDQVISTLLKRTVCAFSSSQYFPISKKLVMFERKDSTQIIDLYELGFVDSSYPSVGEFVVQLKSLEKIIKRREYKALGQDLPDPL